MPLHYYEKRYLPGDAGHIDAGTHFALAKSTYAWGLCMVPPARGHMAHLYHNLRQALCKMVR
jgi:hypothetical protein